MSFCEQASATAPVPIRIEPRQQTPNRLLTALPPDDFGRLMPHLERALLTVKQALFEPNRAIEHVYFIEAGLVSVVAGAQGNGLTEVGMIGREGMVGLPAVFGVQTSPHRAMTQAAGYALRMRADDLRPAMEEIGSLRGLLLRYAQAQMVQAAQGVACNGRHSLRQRLGRWLLDAQDRIEDGGIPVTHEAISKMLAVRRSGVTLALGWLEERGMIEAGRGSIIILNRANLKEASCECHGIIRAEFEKLLG